MFQRGNLWVCSVVLLVFLLSSPPGARAQPLGLGSQPQIKIPEYKVLCSGGGRYVFGQVSDSDKDKFMLDTVTGRLWQIAETGEVGVYLRNVPYRNEKGAYSPFPEDLSGDKAERPEK